MLHIQLDNNPSSLSKKSLDDYMSVQLHDLLTTCHCIHIGGKDYELEVAANAVNGLVGTSETADVYLYAAIERKDWNEVHNIYQTTFRPFILQIATEKLAQALNIN